MSDKRKVNLRILPDGRVRIHFFVRSDAGAITTPEATVQSSLGAVSFGGTKGYIACEPHRKDASPTLSKGVVQPLPFSDDARAATCPECLATQEWKDWMAIIEQAEQPDTTQQQQEVPLFVQKEEAKPPPAPAPKE